MRERRCGWVRLGLSVFSLSVFSLSVFPGEEGIHRQVAAPGGPLFVLFGSSCCSAQRAPMSRCAASIVGKMRTTRSRRRPRKPSGQALDHGCRPKPPTVLRRKRKHRSGVIGSILKNAESVFCFSLQCIGGRVQCFSVGGGGRRCEDRIQPVMHPVLERGRRLVGHVAPEVYTEGFLRYGIAARSVRGTTHAGLGGALRTHRWWPRVPLRARGP